VTYTSLGESEAAINAIENAVALGYPSNLLVHDAGLAAIIDNNRVKALIKDDGD
jgi:hypothetical protein